MRPPNHIRPETTCAREHQVRIAGALLHVREIGSGEPIVVLHGGPDFDHSYLLPDLDRLAMSYRLIYYDQRGRGRSALGPDDVTIHTEIEDLERLREHVELDRMTLLGHSWGGVLAMMYAVRYPRRVSRMILMNTGVASRDDFVVFRDELRVRRAPYAEAMEELALTAAYADGDPDVVAAYYRLHFSAAVTSAVHLERIIASLRASFTPESVLRGRAIERRLLEDTWLSETFDLFPALERLAIPTLVIHGGHDFIPAVCASHIASTIPGARFALLDGCGHFAYVESPDDVHNEIAALFADFP